MVFLIFAILGVQLFAGLLWSCNDDTVAGKVCAALCGRAPPASACTLLRAGSTPPSLFQACPPLRSRPQADCVGPFVDPLTGAAAEREWANQWLNFDNVGAADGGLGWPPSGRLVV